MVYSVANERISGAEAGLRIVVRNRLCPIGARETDFPIRYLYQPNRGKHVAYDHAMPNASVDPSSTTNPSKSRNVCDTRLSYTRCSVWARLYVGMTSTH